MSAWKSPIDDARRRLEEASRSAKQFRRVGGAEEEELSSETAGAEGLRAALEQARRALEERSRELESTRLRARELEREREEWLRRAGETFSPDAVERARRAEEEAEGLRRGSAEETSALKGRLTLLQAEIVRVEALRGKAEEGVQQADRSRRSLEEALRRELREANGAVDRAASAAGAREARSQAEVRAVERRLEAALERLELLERDRRVEREKFRAERERLAASLQRAAAAQAALRKELSESEARASKLQEVPAPPPRAPLPPSRLARRGRVWARLVRRLRPAVDGAYGQLKRLSASVALTQDERNPLRGAASMLAGLAGAVTRLERYLDDGPCGAPAPFAPALEKAFADWRPVLERRGCRAALSIERGLPDVVLDGDDWRLVLDELLQNAFESLPSGSRLSVSARSGAQGGVRVVFEDDGRGLPAEVVQADFEPLQDVRPGRLGLGLALACRILRRWGGDLACEPCAEGARLVLLLRAPSAFSTSP